MPDFKPDLSIETEYDDLFAASDAKYGLPDGMTKLVGMIENRNKPANRVSPKGAAGVMQIMPANNEWLGITNTNDPKQNIMGAGFMLKHLMDKFEGDAAQALAYYNGGGRAQKALAEGRKMNSETTQYLEYAKPYLEVLAAGGNISKEGRKVIAAAEMQESGVSPSDVANLNIEQNANEFLTGLDAEAEANLLAEAQFQELSFMDAAKYGWRDTVTNIIAESIAREDDYDFRLGDAQFKQIEERFPQGLSEVQSQTLMNSYSQVDLDNRIKNVEQDIDFGKRLEAQTGWKTAAAYGGLFGGALLDPVALPAGTFGAGIRIIRGAGAVASVGRAALEGTAAMAMISPVLQNNSTGEVKAGVLLQHMGTGAIFGAGMGTAGRVVGWKGKQAWADEAERAMTDRMDGHPMYEPNDSVIADGAVVDFRGASRSHIGEDGAGIGIGETAIKEAADNWSEARTDGGSQAVADVRGWWYNNKTRQKLLGWLDSENVKLAISDNKIARFVGAQWGGDAGGVGKQQARSAGVMKEVIREELQWDTIPQLKEAYERFLTPAEKMDNMSGGATEAQARFSKEVQLERYRHRDYRAANNGKSDGYVSQANPAVREAATIIDNLVARSKELHVQHGTEHAAQLKDADHVGYIEQRPDWVKLSKVSKEERAAMYDMVHEHYRNEAMSKISKLKSEKGAWIDKQYEFFNRNPEAKGLDSFLKDPEAYFNSEMAKLEKRVLDSYKSRTDTWWRNAISNPTERYTNSEASLMTLTRQMADEFFTDKVVDESLVKSFTDSLTSKWADTTRREMQMTMSRDVGGKEVHLLDLFIHDVFNNVTKTINDTAGRVAMAKLGWKTEQNIADTLMAMRQTGASERDVIAAKFVSDVILNRAAGIADSAAIQTISNMTHQAMMGKLGFSVLADMPTAIANLGIGGMMDALGTMGAKVIDGSLFVRNGRPTQLGNDLGAYLKGMFGHDNELWLPQSVDSNGMAMEVGGALLRRSQAGARFTNTMSGANALTKIIGSGVTRASNKMMLKTVQGKGGISRERLADIGIHSDEMVRIQKQYNKYGDKDNFGLDKWDDPVAKDMLIGASHRFSQQSTMTRSYAGDLPKFTHDNLLGYLFSRFRAIGIKAQEKILVRNLTLADSNTVAMMIGGIAFATFLAYGRIHLDAATSKDGKKVLKDRLTPIGVADTVTRLSSILGGASEVTNLLNIMTGGGVVGGSDTPLTGAVGNITGAASAIGQAATGVGTWKQAADKSYKLVPGANTYQMMAIKKAIED